jgi:hypothetical protein
MRRDYEGMMEKPGMEWGETPQIGGRPPDRGKPAAAGYLPNPARTAIAAAAARVLTPSFCRT